MPAAPYRPGGRGRARSSGGIVDGMRADEVMFYCWSPDADQLDRLADVIAPPLVEDRR